MFNAERISGRTLQPGLFEYVRLPFRRYEILTPMSPAEVTAALQKIVQSAKFFRWQSPRRHRYFEGTVEKDFFKIIRVFAGQNSFVPVIEGSLRTESGQTIVTLNMRMVWIVVVLWSGTFLPVFFIGVIGTNGTERIIPLGMIFMYFLASISFATEVRIAMRRLLRLLRCRDTRSL
jgi:hypothetical protein